MSANDPDVYYAPFDFDFDFEIDADPYPAWRRLRHHRPLYDNERSTFGPLSRDGAPAGDHVGMNLHQGESDERQHA